MSDPGRDLAALIVRAGQRGERVEGLTGIVQADGGDGTVTVDLGGDEPVPGATRLDSYTSPASGDKALVLLVGGVPWVVGRSAAS